MNANIAYTDDEGEGEDPPMLELTFFEGRHDEPKSTHLLKIAGGAVRPDGPPFDMLEEAAAVLDYWCEKYSSPVATSPSITVFIGRETDDTGHVEPVARLDIVVKAGRAQTTLVQGNRASKDLGSTSVDIDDGVAALVWTVLRAYGATR